MILFIFIGLPLAFIVAMYFKYNVQNNGSLLTCSNCGKAIHEHTHMCPRCGGTFKHIKSLAEIRDTSKIYQG